MCAMSQYISRKVTQLTQSTLENTEGQSGFNKLEGLLRRFCTYVNNICVNEGNASTAGTRGLVRHQSARVVEFNNVHALGTAGPGIPISLAP